ncbi:MAG: transcriptional regulator, TetR family [Frondihabitans sp.]|nr:transcriptional regulator, TetR family [Frondihabitans sp.]
MEHAQDGRLARGSARRGLLLNAAVRVVAGTGFGSLTHRAVAAEAGVSVASATYHFPSITQLRRDTLEHAGSSIGLELAALVSAASASVDDTPEICAAYAVRLVMERRIETAAVFELIVAAGHDEDLRPVVALYHGMLADLLTPYERDEGRARTVAAAVQGLLLVHMVSPFAPDPDGLGTAVADLIRRYRATDPSGDAHDNRARSDELHN